MSDESAENDIIDLQMRLTEQEETINQLNIAAARQQQQLDEVIGQLEKVQLILRELVDVHQASEVGGHNEIPPHY